MSLFLRKGVLFSILCALPCFAANFYTDIEPFFGYESVQKTFPSNHSVERVLYGGRWVLGKPLFAVELEYHRSVDWELFPEIATLVQDTENRGRVGLRTSLHWGGMLFFFFRSGAQGTLVSHEITVGSDTTTSTDPLRLNPYFGLGFQVRTNKNISFSADVTAVFRNFPALAESDYMGTVGMGISFP